MQSYVKYKNCYAKKARTWPLQDKKLIIHFTIQSGPSKSKITFRDLRWIGPYVIEKVLPNKNCAVRRINTNNTQNLHQVRLRKYNRYQPLDDPYQNEQTQRDSIIVLPQDHLYTIAWESEIDPIFDDPNAIPHQHPNVIDSQGIIENNTPTNPRDQKSDDG